MEGQNHIGRNSIVYNSHLGDGSGVSRDSIIDSAFIGRYTTLGPDVKIITGQHPSKEIVSIHPAFYSNRAQMEFTYVNETIFQEFKFADEDNQKKVIIGNDVWIGSYVRIMEGVTIGDGSIVAAGSIVTKDVPEYAIVGGVPAKIIRYRFEKNEIDFLKQLRWWDKDRVWLQKNAHLFCNIHRFIGELKDK